jgi:hypothetical protein
MPTSTILSTGNHKVQRRSLIQYSHSGKSTTYSAMRVEQNFKEFIALLNNNNVQKSCGETSGYSR